MFRLGVVERSGSSVLVVTVAIINVLKQVKQNIYHKVARHCHQRNHVHRHISILLARILFHQSREMPQCRTREIQLTKERTKVIKNRRKKQKAKRRSHRVA